MALKKYLVLVVLLLLCSMTSAAFAQRSISEADRLTARNLYNEATAAYDQGLYTDALEKWQEAYRLTETTILLYSIGNAHERLGNLEPAIEALTGYKESLRDREEIGLLEMRIVNLQGRLTAQREAEQLRRAALERERADAEMRELTLRTEQERLAAELYDERLSSIRKDPKGLMALRWTTIGLAGAAVVTGSVFQILASVSTESVRGTCSATGGGSGFYCPDSARDRIDQRDRELKTAQISFIVAGGLGAIGLTTLFIHPNRKRSLDEVSIQPVFYGDGGGLRLRTRF